VGFNLKFFELNIAVLLKSDIGFQDNFEVLSKFINSAMFLDSQLAELHKESGIKYYVFDGLYPIQKNGIYKKDNIYTFRLRSLDENFISKISKHLKSVDDKILDVKVIEKKIFRQVPIYEINNITPTILSFKNDSGRLYHWTFEKDGDIVKLCNALQNNLIKKYESFFKETLNPTQNFIQLLQIKNQKPQTIRITKNGKKIRLFGNKFKIIINEDKISQKLAFVALGCGLGEKNSYGGGFCVGKKGVIK